MKPIHIKPGKILRSPFIGDQPCGYVWLSLILAVKLGEAITRPDGVKVDETEEVKCVAWSWPGGETQQMAVVHAAYAPSWFVDVPVDAWEARTSY